MTLNAWRATLGCMPILKSIPPECQEVLLEHGFELDTAYLKIGRVEAGLSNDRLSVAQEKLSSFSRMMASYLEAFEEEFPELKISSAVRIDRIDVSASGDPDREVIHRAIIEARIKS